MNLCWILCLQVYIFVGSSVYKCISLLDPLFTGVYLCWILCLQVYIFVGCSVYKFVYLLQYACVYFTVCFDDRRTGSEVEPELQYTVHQRYSDILGSIQILFYIFIIL